MLFGSVETDLMEYMYRLEDELRDVDEQLHSANAVLIDLWARDIRTESIKFYMEKYLDVKD
jgi:hypothetical protein